MVKPKAHATSLEKGWSQEFTIFETISRSPEILKISKKIQKKVRKYGLTMERRVLKAESLKTLLPQDSKIIHIQIINDCSNTVCDIL